MPTTYPTLKQSYNHLSEAERGKIEAFLSEGLNQAEIARRLGRNRSTFGHWEIDSVLGLKTAGEPSIMSLVERQTRFALTVKLPEKKAEYVNQAVLECMASYPIKSITADNGSEFALLSELKDVDTYFAHAYASYERGSNEHFNGLLREFVPKGVSLKNALS